MPIVLHANFPHANSPATVNNKYRMSYGYGFLKDAVTHDDFHHQKMENSLP